MNTFVNSFNSSFLTLMYLCSSTRSGQFIFTAWFVLYMLLLPLFMFVLFIGYKKWKKQRRGSTRANISHSDVFTFNMMAMETAIALGSVLFLCGLFTKDFSVVHTGSSMFIFATNGQLFFHCLTCVERYLAVVHPVTYLRLKTGGGVTIRNISIAFAWLLSCVVLTNVLSNFYSEIILILVLVFASLVLVSFCSVSVLCVLIRPRPGEGGGDRNRIDQSKRAAFYTMLAILGVLLTRLVHHLVLDFWYLLEDVDPCVLVMSTFWVTLPSSLVLPLLFLHRARKLAWKKTERAK